MPDSSPPPVPSPTTTPATPTCWNCGNDLTGVGPAPLSNTAYCPRCYHAVAVPPSAPPAPAPGELEELERLARAHIDAEAVADAYGERHGADFDPREYQRLCKAGVAARIALADFATAQRVAQLVAVARRGMEDTARLDHLEAFCDDLTFYHSRGGEPEPVLSWFAGDGDSIETTQGPTWRAAIDASLAAATGGVADAQ